MISDLSPGDKLSLKGKLFELQKKLNIIDIENKRKDEFSFKPTILSYDLPERDSNVLESIRKAEIIQKQRKDLLRASVVSHIEEDCTFAPVFVSKPRRSVLKDQRPVHIRLTEKGKEYNQNIAQKRVDIKKHDFDGKQLFVPQLNKDRLPGTAWSNNNNKSNNNFSTSMNSSFDDDMTENNGYAHNQSFISSVSNLNNVSADEFLYQDAKDREERHKLREMDARDEVQQSANRVKINSSSYQVLKKKAERDIRAVLNYLTNAVNTSSSSASQSPQNNGEIGYDAIRRGSQLLLKHRQLKTDQLEHVTMQVFNLLDFGRTGSVAHSHFVSISIPLLFHQTMHAAMADIRSAFRDLSRATNQQEDEDNEEHSPRGKFSASPDELQTLKKWLSQLAVAVQTRQPIVPVPPVVAPKINEYSLKLAARKERREKQQLVTMLNSDSQHRRRVDERNDGGEPITDDVDDNTVMFDEATTISRMVPLNGARVNPVHQQREIAQSSSGAAPTYQETLEIRQKLSQLKRQQLVEQVTAEKVSECTFRPKLPTKSITAASRSRLNVSELDTSFESTASEQPERSTAQYNHSNNQQQHDSEMPQQNTNMDTIYNRLYLQKRDLRPTSSSDVSSYIIDELKYCTFSPVLATAQSYVPPGSLSNSGVHAASTKSIEGFDKSVSRIRTAQEKQQKQKEADATAHLTLDEKYKHSRVVAKQGAVPFNFKLQERRAEQMQQHRVPRLIIDVKLSATRTAKIPISDHDTPAVLAVKFAKIYSLDANMTSILSAVIAQSMLKNGIPMTVDRGDERATQDSDEDDLSRSDESEGSNVEEDEGADDSSTLDTASIVQDDGDLDVGTAETSETDLTPKGPSPLNGVSQAAAMNEGYMRHKLQMQQQHSKMLSNSNRNSPFNVLSGALLEDVGELSDD